MKPNPESTAEIFERAAQSRLAAMKAAGYVSPALYDGKEELDPVASNGEISVIALMKNWNNGHRTFPRNMGETKKC